MSIEQRLQDLLAREAIRQTMAQYNMAGDRVKTEDFVAAFTEDGILESDGVPAEDGFRYEGHDELRAWMSRWRTAPKETPVHAARFVRHHLSTCQIELTGPDTAKARTYWTAYTNIGPDHGGVYVDIFQRAGERWLIAHRRVRVDWRAEKSLFAKAVERTKAPGEQPA